MGKLFKWRLILAYFLMTINSDLIVLVMEAAKSNDPKKMAQLYAAFVDFSTLRIKIYESVT